MVMGDVRFLLSIRPVTPIGRRRLNHRIVSGGVARSPSKQPQRVYGGMAAASWTRLPWSSQTFQGNPRIAEGPATFPAATHSG
jgi:hypothetical protein